MLSLSGGDKVRRGGRGNPFQGTHQALSMGPAHQPVEGARHRRHQDSLSSEQTFLPGPDEARAGAEGLCQSRHHTGDGTPTHERLRQHARLDRHGLHR